MTKRCPKCNTLKNVSYFNKNKTKKDGLQSICNSCKHDLYLEKQKEIILRSRMWRINNKNSYKKWRKNYRQAKGKRKLIQANKRYKEKYPQKFYCKQQVKNALRNDNLLKPKVCSSCKIKMKLKYIHAHHSDYSFPLRVIWLCIWCHNKLHYQPKSLKSNLVGNV